MYNFLDNRNIQSLMQKLAKFILKIIGWTCEAKTPDFKKSILVVAPHTSNWDFLLGEIGYTAIGRKANFVIKEEWMRWPFGGLIRKLGGIPVDRSKATNFTDKIVEIYNTHDVFNMAITPEGTRKRNPRWKRGFYVIAEKANIPIVLVKIDYEKKDMCMFEVFEPTGDIATDIQAIKMRYKGCVAKHPENFSIGD